MITDDIYIVTSEWNNDNEHEFAVVGAFFDYKKAIQAFEKNRNMELAESYGFDSLEEAKNSEDVTIEEDDMRFFIKDKRFCNKWDEFIIHERKVEQRDFIVVKFEFLGESFEERIYVDDIDLTHYDTCWDWWFSSRNKNYPDLNFELTADKDDDGNISCEGMYVNVYENDDSLTPIKTIDKVKWQYSWIERRQNYVD